MIWPLTEDAVSIAPARTPRTLVNKLHADIVKVVEMQDTRAKLMSQGADPGGNTPEQFTAMLQEELTKWAKLVKAAKIKID